MSFRLLFAAGGLALAALSASGVAALAQGQSPAPAAPAAAAPQAESKVTFTQAQVDAGRAEYMRSCIDCHGPNLDDGEFGGAPLRGSMFRDKWFGGTVDYLYDFMKTNMPPDRPGALTDQTYANIVAFVLSRNGIQPGGAELPADMEKMGSLVIE